MADLTESLKRYAPAGHIKSATDANRTIQKEWKTLLEQVRRFPFDFIAAYDASKILYSL